MTSALAAVGGRASISSSSSCGHVCGFSRLLLLFGRYEPLICTSMGFPATGRVAGAGLDSGVESKAGQSTKLF